MSEFENKNNNLEFRKNLRSRKFDDSKTANAKRKKTIFFFSIICSMAISAPLIYPKMAEKNDAFANIFNNDKPSNNLVEGKLDDKEENVKSSDDTNKSNSETLAASSVEPTTLNNETSVANSSANEPSTTSSETTATQTQESQKSSNSVEYMTVDDSYFSDALFIGDSRTVGIHEYGKLTTPDYFCSNGLSSYTILKENINVKGFGKTTLGNLLSKKTYGKIYIMIGVNELGNVMDELATKMNDLITAVRKAQPNAIIYLQGNLHVTAARANTDKYINNVRMNELNSIIASHADNKKTFYIDPNILFDDENGNLRQDYSADNSHIYAKYYVIWTDWLKTKAIKQS
jgi:hypothetical protein